MSSINRTARQAVYQRLSDSEAGMNSYITAIAADYAVSPFAMDFSDSSLCFFQTFLDPDSLQSTTPVQYPLGLLYTVESENKNLEKFRIFSGPITVVFRMYLSWRGSQVQRNSEDYCDLVQEAVFRCINEWDYPWAQPLAYNGQIKLEKGQLTYGGDYWRQALTFSIPFDLHTN